jgi:predicted RNase H-like HicB family nuclease
MTYRVVVRHSDEGYSVSCPSLPGCHSQGETEEEALGNIKSAIQEYLDAKAELNLSDHIREVDVVAG